MKKPHIGRVHVKGHFRKDGTRVRAHTRSWPDRHTTYRMIAEAPMKQSDSLVGLSGLLVIIALFVYRDAWWPWMTTAYQWAVQANLPWWLYVVGYICLALLVRQIWWWLVAAATFALLVSVAGWLLSWARWL